MESNKIQKFVIQKISELNPIQKKYILEYLHHTSEELLTKVIEIQLRKKCFDKYKEEFMDETLKELSEFKAEELIQALMHLISDKEIDIVPILKQNQSECKERDQERINALKLKKIHKELAILHDKTDPISLTRKNELFEQYAHL